MITAVLDIGKTNAKIALVDTIVARELDVLSMPTPMLDGHLYRQPDVEALWQFFIDSLSALGAKRSIEAIGITTHGATVALLDIEGELVMPVLDYEDDGPDEFAADYDALRAPFSETGSPRLPGGLNVGAQLYWQERRFPERFARVAHIVTWPQYWAWRLSGELASDLTSLGCHTDLLDPASGSFSSLAQERGWDRLLPPVRRSGEPLGLLREEIAQRTGLSTSTLVHVGIHDSNASLVPHLLAANTARAVVSTGTWVIAMSLDGQAHELDASRDVLVNVDARGRAVPSSRFMGGREYELLTRDRNRDNATPDTINDLMNDSIESGRTARANSTHFNDDETCLAQVLGKQMMLLPAVVRGCGPFPDRELHWTVPENSLDDAAHAIVVAHYLALMTFTCLELIGAQGPIIVEGPFAANRHYLRMLGAASGRPVETGVNATGTSVGTAMLITPPQTLPASVSEQISPEWQERLALHAELWLQRTQKPGVPN